MKQCNKQITSFGQHHNKIMNKKNKAKISCIYIILMKFKLAHTYIKTFGLLNLFKYSIQPVIAIDFIKGNIFNMLYFRNPLS
jgi:hypothetical protein